MWSPEREHRSHCGSLWPREMQEYDPIVTLDMQSAPGHCWPGLPWPTCLQCQEGQNSVVWGLALYYCITIYYYVTIVFSFS